MAHILICDDENNLRELLAMALTTMGHQVEGVATAAAAHRLLDNASWDLVITDLKLPDGSGLDLLRQVKRLAPECPVLLITAYATTETAVTAMKEGAFEYLEKPFRMEDLHLVVTRALEQGRLYQENSQLRQALRERGGDEEIVAKSAVMQRVLELVERVARTSTTVLITGESGTGKELVARSIHQRSSRAGMPFVGVNCAAIPENLIESELFGHAKGAFSGAVNSRKGLFMEAEGGTLLLDEISEMPLNTQAKLLRVLQERTVRSVGGSGERSVDVRVIATTNRDPVEAVQAGRFREDLYYRLNVVQLALPPLRDRREDIPLLAARFIDLAAKRHQLPVKYLDPKAMDCLLNYDFPGNVRELANLIEGVVSLTVGDRVELSGFPAHVREAQGCRVALHPRFSLEQSGVDLEQTLLTIERQLIQQAMERSGGNKTRAAELLGLSFRSFRYRLAKLGMAE